MKIAIASVDKTQDSQISIRAGRSPYFQIYENGKFIEAWKNPFSAGGGGAGFGVAKALADKGVQEIIAGKFGDNFYTALEESSIKYQEMSGIIKDIIKLVNKN